ncbi:hypothetical protein KPH14_006782 [Odynerus spinipes]|uniref:Uncharacterized protein n=1 Tax=Odynerus spinipes TaxID=1348599 RepID=A0AAD9RR89_9HYME|nr:hypothetical protein KPH14_006782 [Odynerus spinipes]
MSEAMDKPWKLVARATGIFIVTVGVIHAGWYYIRERYVPEEQRKAIPIVRLAEILLGKDEEKSSDAKKH